LAGFGFLCSLLTGCFESPPQIIALNPPRGSQGVQADTPVVVQFDRPVVPASLNGRVSVSPAISGCDLGRAFTAPLSTACRAVWISGNTAFVIQHPRAIFAPRQPYRFTVLGGFSSPDGTVNSVDHRWDITTASAPEVRTVTPGDGTRSVPVDSVITVAFSGGMSDQATSSAIQLNPAAPGSRVVRNSLDNSRFVVFPGRLLQPDTRYRVTITRAATDQHHQPLLAAVQTSFTTGTLGPGGHAVVLAGRIGERATQVLITGLAPSETGVPVANAVALEAPRCHMALGCGDAPDGSPLYVFSAATLSPGGRWLAVVEHDATVAGSGPTLIVLDAARERATAAIAGGDMPAWAPDAATLAYAAGGDVALYQPGVGRTRTLPPGDPLLSAPVWKPQGELLALEVGTSRAKAHVQLADTTADARYPLPYVDGVSSDPAISPDGSQLALVRAGPGGSGTWLAEIGGGTAPPRLLDPNLVPIGYAADGALLAVAQAPAGPATLVRVNVDSDDSVGLTHQPGADALATVVLSASLRRFAFLAPDLRGVEQAYVETSDGSAAYAITTLGGGLVASGVSLSG
jgi:hypothetical protein